MSFSTPEPMPSNPVALTRTERTVIALDVLLGVALCGLAVLMLRDGLRYAANPSNELGGTMGLFGAAIVGPPGLLFGLAAVAVARRWRGRWWFHLVPPLISPTVLLALELGLLGG